MWFKKALYINSFENQNTILKQKISLGQSEKINIEALTVTFTTFKGVRVV